MPSTIQIVDEERARKLIGQIDLAGPLRRLFSALHAGTAVQPAQTLTLFANGAGDFISYPAADGDAGVFGIKMSPYIQRSSKPVITAWTLLMSMATGQPLLLCDAGHLTTERTAGVTALAVDLLAAVDAQTLAVIGTGALAEAHLRHVLPLRRWDTIRVTSRAISQKTPRDLQLFTERDSRVTIAGSVAEAVADADVVMLCTSSAVPVFDPGILTRRALITSISTNAVRAHEIPPASLGNLDVYCDYRATAPLSAGEMLLACEQGVWSPDAILGDLPELVAGTAKLVDGAHHRFFRSIGLGLEDITIANEVYRSLSRQLEYQS